MSTARIGVIADDVTGACDVAAELVHDGHAVDLILDVPAPDDDPSAGEGGEASFVVIGLRTRTAPRARAVGDTLAAAGWLRSRGITRWYQKYCSTFDSTDEGMIGPVAEALMDAAGRTWSVGTPCTPHADRTVYRGHVFVGGRLLSESPLAHHPLTPMTDPDLVRVLARQSSRAVGLVDHRTVSAGSAAVVRAIRGSRSPHILLDALDDEDLDVLAEAVDELGDACAVGGGAGLVTALGRRMPRAPRASSSAFPDIAGPGLIVVGSASSRTREQIAFAGGITATVDVRAAAADPAAEVARCAGLVAAHAERHPGRPALISASHDPSALRAAQDALGVGAAAALAEELLAGITCAAVATVGVRRLLVAGGETSGAVARALGIARLRLTRRVDPGVAWSRGVARTLPGTPELDVLLKSGNFGGADLFVRAWAQESEQ